MPSPHDTPLPAAPDAPLPHTPAPTDSGERGDCRNCGTPLLGEHCYACGQPVKGLVRHFSSLVGDVLDSVFEWDGRIPRTLGPLLARPGYLTQEYLAGRRVRYVTPFRLFFFIAIVTFFFGRFVVDFGENGGVNFGGDNNIATALSVEDVEKARDAALAGIQAERDELAPKIKAAEGQQPAGVGPIIGLRNADAALQAAEATVRAQADERIQRLREATAKGEPPPPPDVTRLNFGQGEWDASKNPIAIAWLPAFANAWLNDQAGRTVKNIDRLQEDPALFKDAMMGAVPSTLFLLLPVFALMLKLLYVFKRRLYMEHIIVALHSHAFLCLALLLLFVLIALERWLVPGGGAGAIVFDLLEAALWAWMPVYLLLMQKRVYGQGWTMTLLKYCTLGFCYVILLSLGAAFTAITSLVWM